MAYQPKKRKVTCEINIVPYIDVMFVLLIIFMVTAPFVTQGVDVDLPSTTTAKTAAELVGENSEKSPIIVEVDQDGHLGISVDDREMQRGLGLNELLTVFAPNCSSILNQRCWLVVMHVHRMHTSSKPSMPLIRLV